MATGPGEAVYREMNVHLPAILSDILRFLRKGTRILIYTRTGSELPSIWACLFSTPNSMVYHLIVPSIQSGFDGVNNPFSEETVSKLLVYSL